MRLFRKRKERRQRQLDGIEYYLMEAFSPVAPSQEFVSELRNQLSGFSIPVPLPPAKMGKYTILAIISVLGGGLFLAILIRYIIALVAIIKLVRQAQSERVSSSI